MTEITNTRLSTGVAGLDEILFGGLMPGCSYLVRGGPGSGKTTLGLHFLAAGAANGEKTLFITLEEPEAKLRANAARRGLDRAGIEFLDLSPTSAFFAQVETYDIFTPAEVEREPITRQITEQVGALKPTRVFLDPITQFRYLTRDVFQFRRQVLSFLRFLVEQGATVLFSSESSPEAPDDDLQFLSDGVIEIYNDGLGRGIRVNKLRGSDFRGGRHTLRMTDHGLEVYPRLMPDETRREFSMEAIPSGVPELDELLHGGLERGAVTIISGPSGVGKTTLGLQFMKEAAGRGEHSVIYTFEEEIEIMVKRAEAINIPARVMLERGTLSLVKVEPLRWSADEFASLVRRQVEQEQARVVMLDSIAGYRLAVRGEDLTAHMHALTKYLQNMGVAVLLVAESSAVVGDFQVTDVGISYLADNIVFLRYLEMDGEMRKAIGVLKKRMSDFEKTLREFEITRYGIKVGKPLTGLRGILRGEPEWVEKS
ncbi:MAG TPA: ATPase domain-containing protein [Anaerolineae bacterium]|nr:ATPase domain-containing protein [Anaerolineae bacterium]HQK15075.1 ATPase domain-containing protein [Anaerolineae bacterium]